MFRISNIRIGTKLMIMSGLGILLIGAMIYAQMSGNIAIQESDSAANLTQQLSRRVLEAKISIRDLQISARGVNLAKNNAEIAMAMKDVVQQENAVYAHLDPLIKQFRVPENRERAEKIKALAADYVAGAKESAAVHMQMFDLRAKNDADIDSKMAALNKQAANIVLTRLRPVTIKIEKEMTDILDRLEAAVHRRIDESAQNMRSSEQTNVIIGALAVVILIGASVFGIISIARPLVELIKPINELAAGNFSIAVSGVGRKDEVGQIATAVNAMAERIRTTIGEIKQTAMEVNSASGEITTSTTDLSLRTEEQAASLEETTAAMEEMSSTVRQSAQNADQANRSADQARQFADQGGEVVSKAVSAMAKIEDSSRKISDIIGVIDEIARQTNLLALNAAVEAARAGEAGRGFAVVASEVRSLAQRSSQAAKDIKELITNSNGQVQEGVELVNHVGGALNKIVASVKEVADLVSDIARASAEQSTGLDQINKALMQMDEATQQNAALVEENAATAKALENQAQSMDERVSFFKIDHAVSFVGNAAMPKSNKSGNPKVSASVAPRKAAAPYKEVPQEAAVLEKHNRAAA